MSRPSPLARVALAVLLSGAALALTAADLRAEEALHRTSDGDTVRWDPGLEGVAARAAERLPTLRLEVVERLGAPPDPGTAEVLIVRGHDRMREEVRGAVPEWAVGVTVPSRHRIVLRSDLLDRGVGGGLIPVLRHEWVHLTWARLSGPMQREIPLWLEEGVAEVIGGGASLEMGQTLDGALASGSLIPFDELASRFPAEAVRSDLAYKQCRSWVGFFLRERGWDDLRAILAGTLEQARAGVKDAFSETVRARTGRGVGEWHVAWRRSLEEESRSRLPWILRDVGLLALVVAALIAIFASAFLRRRRRREIAALPDDPLPPS